MFLNLLSRLQWTVISSVVEQRRRHISTYSFIENSYSHQLIAVGGVALALLWLFRSDNGGKIASLASQHTRVEFCALIALLIPLDGSFPFATDLIDIPNQIIHNYQPWLVPAIMIVLGYSMCVGLIFLLVSAGVKFYFHTVAPRVR